MKHTTVLALLLVSAAAARILYDHSLAPEAIAAPPRIPFSEFPLDVAGPGWRGQTLELDEAVIERSGVSDYVSQRYTDGRRTLWVYVGYVGGYSPDSIHYPEICFPGNGLELESKAVRRFPISGIADDAAMNEYLWRRKPGGGTYTLSTFCYNGKFEPHEWRLRADRIVGIPYFAIITISGDLMGDLETTRAVYHSVLERMIPQLMKHLPPTGIEAIDPAVHPASTNQS